ncbi:hypothetical protein C8Q79DRAFT_1014901 [Trametes meyenii]|nr:hypothetical protein C8Q79DRAFT_1014901 [Trametes meyenii]
MHDYHRAVNNANATVVALVFQENCIIFSVKALLLFDYLITLGEEVRLFWKRKATAATVLYVIVRYWTLAVYALLNLIAVLLSIPDTRLGDTSTILTPASRVYSAAFSALRVFALSQKNWVLSSTVFILSLGPVAVNLTVYGYGLRGQNAPLYGCQGLDGATVVEVSAVSRTGLILAETLVIVVTLAQAWNGLFRFDRRTAISSLTTVLIYDGTKYYVVLLILNISEVIMVHFSNTPILPGVSYITQISEPLTAIFISRFLLDLQAANQATRELNSRWSPGVSIPIEDNPATLVFASLTAGSVDETDGVGLNTTAPEPYAFSANDGS